MAAADCAWQLAPQALTLKRPYLSKRQGTTLRAPSSILRQTTPGFLYVPPSGVSWLGLWPGATPPPTKRASMPAVLLTSSLPETANTSRVSRSEPESAAFPSVELASLSNKISADAAGPASPLKATGTQRASLPDPETAGVAGTTSLSRTAGEEPAFAAEDASAASLLYPNAIDTAGTTPLKRADDANQASQPALRAVDPDHASLHC